MSMIEFHDVNKYFGKFQALKNINLTIDRGEVVTIIGPSGSGKVRFCGASMVLNELLPDN